MFILCYFFFFFNVNVELLEIGHAKPSRGVNGRMCTARSRLFRAAPATHDVGRGRKGVKYYNINIVY